MPTRAKQARLILPSAAEAKPKVKELDRMHGLDTYDYGARQYDPLLCRWTSIDPLCEKYYSVSPYVYCMNNPVKNADPDGRKVVIRYGPKGQNNSYIFTGFHGNKFIIIPNDPFVKAVIQTYVFNCKNGESIRYNHKGTPYLTDSPWTTRRKRQQ